MITLCHNTTDPYVLYGIRHFIDRYGIAVETNTTPSSGSRIAIAYGAEAEGDFLIRIAENAIQDRICGRLVLTDEKIPLWEIPHDTGAGDSTSAFFETAGKRYPCLTPHTGGTDIGIDIFRECGYLLSGHQDRFRGSLDETTKDEINAKPIVDALEDLLYTEILAACDRLKIPLVQKSYWPGGRPFAVCLTHDVDELKKTYQYFTRALIALSRGDFRGMKRQWDTAVQKLRGTEPYWTFEDIIAIEKTFQAKSTYFLLKESGRAQILIKKTWSVYGRNRRFDTQDVRRLVRILQENGDEIGIHGSFFSYRDPSLLMEETNELERITGTRITGTRQHHLNLDIPATWEHQIQAGLKYDTTLGFNSAVGFRWGTSFPFFPHTRKETIPILEIPLIIMDNYLETVPDRERVSRTLADEVKKYHGVLTLLWHPRSLNPIEFPDSCNTYVKLNQYCQSNGAWMARAGDIYRWLCLRNSLAFSCRYSDSVCTIVPASACGEHFYTINLQDGTDAKIRSGNADIISRDGKSIHLRSRSADIITVEIGMP